LFVPFAFPKTGDDRPLFALSPNGARLAVSWEGADSVHVFDARTGRAVTSCKSLKHVYCVAFASANALLAATEKGCVRFDLTRRRRETLLSDPTLRSIDMSPDGRIVAFGIERGVVLYDTRKKQVLHRLTCDLMGRGFDGVWGRLTAFSTGVRYVACAILDWYYHASFVVIWEVQTGRRQRVFDALARALAFRDDTLSLALADDWGYFKAYEPEQGEEPAVEFKYCEVDYTARALSYRAQERAWELLLDKGTVVRIAAGTGKVTRHAAAPAREGLQRAVVCADWSTVAAAMEDGIAVWLCNKAERGAAPDPARK
jgi:hypothetical protein